MRIEKLQTRHPSYASFHVVADEAHRDALLTSDAWDEGTLVKKFYSPRQDTEDRRAANSGSSQENLESGNGGTMINSNSNIEAVGDGTRQPVSSLESDISDNVSHHSDALQSEQING